MQENHKIDKTLFEEIKEIIQKDDESLFYKRIAQIAINFSINHLIKVSEKIEENFQIIKEDENI